MFSPGTRHLLCVLAFLGLGTSSVSAYIFNGYKWPYGTQIVVHLGLNRPAVPLQDGSASWNASAADTLAIWNQHLLLVQFAAAGAATEAAADGINSAWFSNAVFGDAWPRGALAVTITYSPRPVFTEADVIFNNTLNWNSYRGPVQGSGSTATWDLHRVALHEFGHVLGLDHPNAYGQAVSAIMNSEISHLDQLSDDDAAGARALYPGSITSSLFPPNGRLAHAFSYQITANFNASSYGAQGLPPGLSVNPESGLISGVPTAAGTFEVLVTASRGLASASATVRIVIRPPQITSQLVISVPSGNLLHYQITADNNPTRFTASGLPPDFTFDGATGVISGRPVAARTFRVDITAEGSIGVAVAYLWITVAPLPLTSTTHPPRVLIGTTLSYQITAGNNPTSFTAERLPAGLIIDAATGLISGAPTVWGTFVVTVRAIGATSEAGGMVTFEILPPYITSRGPASGEIGKPFAFQVTATHPATFSASGLLPGLQIDPNTGLISGTPILGGTFEVQLTARTAFGDVFGRMTINILAPAVEVPRPRNLINVSTRLRTLTGDAVPIAGFVIEGNAPKRVIVRAIGPSLPLNGQLDDPTLTLHARDGRVLTSNNNWRENQTDVLAANLPPADDREAAIVATLDPGAYTAILRGANGSTGITLVEVYDLTPESPSRIKNLSTRGRVEAGDNVMIGGFVISGDQPMRVMIRALGPSLAWSRVPDVLANPTLELYNSDGVLFASNDDWSSNQFSEITATGLSLGDWREAALVMILPPGAYTAIVRGKNGTSGVGLIEIYNLEPAVP